ncbi:hypothetical protein AWB99_14905 [Mycolicibacterium confluentis]|uniref:Uncharacterized protein n=1 Tax=Mycolicibacterium confluentis TaxID=28047 RepID=A0A7I7Y384_9MYCO|nr:hypothetical protein AWB99_14905 [Mycolicibacterium confluentis]BBZ35784.1 hypothetical protein MCNF_43890 [Mycolicibacterium confluentis]
MLLDVAGTGTSGFQAADWLREQCGIDMGMSDHRRTLATLSFADDERSIRRLVDAMTRWRDAACSFDPAPRNCSWRP